MSKEHYELQQFYNKLRELILYEPEDWLSLCMRHGELAHGVKNTLAPLTRSSMAEQDPHKVLDARSNRAGSTKETP